MGCRARRTRLLAAAAGVLWLAGPVRAFDVGPPPSHAVPHKRLDLGLYGSPYGDGTRLAQPSLRFDAWVDVEAAPEPTLDETMNAWMKRFDLGEQAVYGRGYALDPNAHPNSVNRVPVFKKIYDSLKKKK
jgi:hypothetical protein